MNAAKRRHAIIHANTVAWLVYNQKEYNWLVDLDIHVLHDDQAFILRPDIVGEDKKEGKFRVFIEISDSTLQKDLNHKLDVYASQNFEFYIVVDCKNEVVKQFRNVKKEYQEHEVFRGIDEIFKLGSL